ncbi:di-heme oxidoredictase family protein [Microbaculum marinisediminis]|uniref:C-type cytochrome n=1 Tax=Microbaculum marinisediminis TaxID=2931392 RepID=A0AAW5QRZ8_9HYPH|nr:di-heme oxidoredictase family protein [Microbaculum sp. A6E488]MCT8970740.1 c-type cytochrome [Microbaculum sp. A6E488]
MSPSRRLIAGIAVVTLAGAAVAASTGRDDLSLEDLARVRAVTAPAQTFDKAETFEAMPGGAATVKKIVNRDIFSHPSANLSFEGRQTFAVGNGLFRKDWVTSPSSTQASDGLGPLFNARSCQGCHLKDGRGHPPASAADDAVTMLVRLSVPPSGDAERQALADRRALVIGEPVYGAQLQDFAVPGLASEGRVTITYEDVPVALNGGETATLRKPTLDIADPGYGPMHPDTMTSMRIAQPMIGLGLLEAIAESDILAGADPDDADGDGISGRPNYVRDPETGEIALGRFGWKAITPSIRVQSASAFSGDMGLSSPPAPDPHGDCTQAQADCRAQPTGVQTALGADEVPGDLLDLVVFYAANLAVPARRDSDDPAVLAGKAAFYAAGCAACHTPKFVTRRDAEHEALRFQLIWPYSDMLLHDMGEGLADNRPEGDAHGREWRTQPLWGIGLTKTVNEEATFLHDGRARTILEAVLWHGGEAQAARDRVVEMTPGERANLIRFLESL